MTDEKFESFLKNKAQGYNAPPVRAPREEMWRAIQAERAASPRVVYGGGFGFGAQRHERVGRRVLMALAAGLVLVATGVGIGRWTASPTTSEAPRQIVDNVPARPESRPDVGTPATERSEAPVPPVRERETRERTREPRPQLGVAPAERRLAAVPDASTAPAAAAGDQVSVYQLATQNHLSQAEALLTSFRTRSPADQQMDAQLSSWARDLLSKTRLLLDSPVAADPERLPLLRDLELLLAQIVQLSPGSTPQDREIVEKTLKQDHVLSRLRTAIPAGERGS